MDLKLHEDETPTQGRERIKKLQMDILTNTIASLNQNDITATLSPKENNQYLLVIDINKAVKSENKSYATIKARVAQQIDGLIKTLEEYNINIISSSNPDDGTRKPKRSPRKKSIKSKRKY